MSLEKIISVTGKSGLFRLVAQMKNGIIVESLEDGKRLPVHGSAKVSALEEISIYTTEEELPLNDVFKRIFEKHEGKPVKVNRDDQKKVIEFFKTIVADYDSARVYVSDMVKVIRWYNQLVEKSLYDPNKQEEAPAEAVEAAEAEKPKSEKKAKKTTAKKTDAAAKTKAPSKAATKAKSASINAPRKAGGTQRGS